MKINWETKLVRVNTMTSSDYDALAYVVKNFATSTMEQMSKATGLSRYKLDAMMRTFGISKHDGVYAMDRKTVSDLTQCQEQETKERRRREKTPSERNRIMRKWALRKLDRQIEAATDKVVVYPYMLQPSLGVTEREQLLFEKYKILYL